jgi:hypothetical protein
MKSGNILQGGHNKYLKANSGHATNIWVERACSVEVIEANVGYPPDQPTNRRPSNGSLLQKKFLFHSFTRCQTQTKPPLIHLFSLHFLFDFLEKNVAAFTQLSEPASKHGQKRNRSAR